MLSKPRTEIKNQLNAAIGENTLRLNFGRLAQLVAFRWTYRCVSIVLERPETLDEPSKPWSRFDFAITHNYPQITQIPKRQEGRRQKATALLLKMKSGTAKIRRALFRVSSRGQS
jgi:hypothetical protein